MIAIGVPLVCSLGLLAGAAILLARAVRAAAARPFVPAMRWVLAALALVYACGIWWGLPWAGWGPDEVPPDVFLDAMRKHFLDGWHDKYPQVHFYLNAVLYLPWVAAERLGQIDLTSNAAQIALLVVSRVLSTVMALGTVCAIYILADDLYRRSRPCSIATSSGRFWCSRSSRAARSTRSCAASGRDGASGSPAAWWRWRSWPGTARRLT